MDLSLRCCDCHRYPDIEYKEMIVDNACMQLVRLLYCPTP